MLEAKISFVVVVVKLSGLHIWNFHVGKIIIFCVKLSAIPVAVTVSAARAGFYNRAQISSKIRLRLCTNAILKVSSE